MSNWGRTTKKEYRGGCNKNENEEKDTKGESSGQNIESIERMHSLNDPLLKKLKFY